MDEKTNNMQAPDSNQGAMPTQPVALSASEAPVAMSASEVPVAPVTGADQVAALTTPDNQAPPSQTATPPNAQTPPSSATTSDTTPPSPAVTSDTTPPSQATTPPQANPVLNATSPYAEAASSPEQTQAPVWQPGIAPNPAPQPNPTPAVPTTGGIPKKTIKLLIIIGSVVVVLGGLLLAFFLTNGFGLLRSEEMSCAKFEELEEWRSKNDDYSFDQSDLTAGGERQAKAEKYLSMSREAANAHPNEKLRNAMNTILDAAVENDYTKIFSVVMDAEVMEGMDAFSEKCDVLDIGI
ncbi:MAG: hypothetical protein LBE03_00155 [Candidatus Nomurabacteria bacterium]|jgi:hypothetical protein|nr:hypothetical protein [Candidatus Nomurabacteria bacterium]